jgi:hypothetical protein
VLLFGQGCYTYRPAQLPGVEPGVQVRVLLRDDDPFRLRPRADEDGGYRLDGSFVRLTEDSLSLSVWLGEAYRGTPFESVRQEYTFPRGDILRVEHRQFSRLRTTLLGAGIAVGIVALIKGIGQVIHDGAGQGGEPPLPPVPPVELLIPR